MSAELDILSEVTGEMSRTLEQGGEPLVQDFAADIVRRFITVYGRDSMLGAEPPGQVPARSMSDVDAQRQELDAQVEAAQEAAGGDSNDAEIQALQEALDFALALLREVGVPVRRYEP